MIYDNDYLIQNCILAENRKVRPFVHEEDTQCPFCPKPYRHDENVFLEVKNQEHFLIKIMSNQYPVCTPYTSLYGVHDVVVDTPHHLEHPKDFTKDHWTLLLNTMQKRWVQLTKDKNIRFIQIFKNHGKDAGASISHSHWQIIALGETPYQMLHQYQHYELFKQQKKECYLCYKLKNFEEHDIILENDFWLVIAPMPSEFAHETWIIPKKHRNHYGDLSLEELQAVGYLLKTILESYNKLIKDYSFNICFMSGDVLRTTDYHFYIKIIPRLSQWAGFELATHCSINTVHPKTHVQLMKSILKE